jgi:hypothetical protein
MHYVSVFYCCELWDLLYLCVPTFLSRTNPGMENDLLNVILTAEDIFFFIVSHLSGSRKGFSLTTSRSRHRSSSALKRNLFGVVISLTLKLSNTVFSNKPPDTLTR